LITLPVDSRKFTAPPELPRVKRGFYKSDPGHSRQGGGTGDVHRRSDCVPGSKVFVVRKDAFALSVKPAVFLGLLHAEVKPRLIFETDGDSPVDGNANFAGNLTQPVVPVLANKPAVQSRGGCG
jgi:hypothetical protein